MRRVLVVALLAAVPRVVEAQIAPAEVIATKLKSGDTVYVLDSASREITGVFGKASDSALTLMVNGDLRDVPFSEVRRITRRGGDSLWNGLLIGACVGGLAGGAMQGVGPGIGGAVIYGAIGALIDSAVAGRVVVYRAPASKSVSVGPLLAEGRRGVRVSIKF